MSNFIEPFEFGYWIRNVFSGSNAIFTAIALITITAMAAYFRMTAMMLVLILSIFMIMFYNYIDQSIYFLLISIGGLLIGYWISKVVKN